jgi:hypothetical protein
MSHQVMSKKHDAVSNASTVATLGWVTACVLLLAGCSAGNVEDTPGYEEGFEAGKAQGLEEGKEEGKREVCDDAMTQLPNAHTALVEYGICD